MQIVEEIIKITNKIFIKNIKKQIKEIKKTSFIDEVKNNLSMAGELFIDSINMCKNKKLIDSISLLRNVYEMTLKGIVIDKDRGIYNSYKIIKKKQKINKDSSKEVREYIGKNFNQFFYMIENDDIFDRIYGAGILTYLYDKLCNYSHASIIMEEVYKIGNKEKIIEQMICIFLIYTMVLFYMDAICVKMKQLEVTENTCIFYTIITLYIFSEWKNNEEEFHKLRKYGDIIDLSIELNKEYYSKEKDLVLHIAQQIQNEKIVINKNNEIVNRLKKYCGENYYKKIISLISTIEIKK